MRRLALAFIVGSAISFAAPARAAEPAADELAVASRAVDEHPDDVASYDSYAQAAFKLRRWDEAIARLKQGTTRISAYHGGWYKLAYAYRQKRDFALAAAAYRKFGELEPGRSDTYFGLGAALQGAGDRKGALAAYKRYVELEKAPEKQKFVDQAKGEIAKLSVAPTPTPSVKSVPVPTPPPTPNPPLVAPPSSDSIAKRAEGDRLRQAGKLDEASTAYERALAADPGNLEIHVELGDAYFSQRRYADAARIFRAAVTKDAGYALAWYNLAHAESRAGEHGAAVRAYREYIRLRPSDPDPFYGLGQTYKSMGDTKSAADAFRTYLQMERRPESQRWVDKARRELEALEGGAPHANRGGRVRDLKNPFDDHAAYASSDDLLPPGEDTVGRREHDRINRELAADDILPIDAEEEARARPSGDLKDPFKDSFATAPVGKAAPSRERLARYASALAAYRVALDRQASEIAALYQRGTERVLANDLRGAQRAWSAGITADRSIEDARARLERAREQRNAK